MNSLNERSRSVAFIRLLIEDVLAARDQLDGRDSQGARRNVVRTSLSAMEGLTWIAREHVLAVLSSLDELSPIADLALREQIYIVSDNGKLDVQSRSLPLPTALRFVIAQAQIASPEITVDFTVKGWSDLREAVAVRNRITHPRPDSDLNVSDADLGRVSSGLSWLLATADYVMASTNLALTSYTEAAKDVVARLASGDPDAIAEYRAVLASISSPEPEDKVPSSLRPRRGDASPSSASE